MADEGLNIQQWITGDPLTVRVGETLQQAVKLMAERKVGALLVTDADNRLVGVFTERDLVRILSENHVDFMQQPVSDFMTPDPVCSEKSEDYNAVYTKMKTHNIRHVPVVDGEHLVGIVSIRDLIHFYQNKLEAEFVDAQKRINELEKLSTLTDDERLKTLVSEIDRYKTLSLTDPLTGLYNKRYFSARLEEEVARSRRYGQDLSLIFCDVDHFKSINDNYGHAVGDEVLVQIAVVLSGGLDRLNVVSRLRKSDIVARYGGEEFVAILPETPAAGAGRAAENVRATIQAHNFKADGSEMNATMSFGVAEHNEDTSNAEMLIKNADYALYQAKENGRNRVEVYQA